MQVVQVGAGGVRTRKRGWGRMDYTTAILNKLDEAALRDALNVAYGDALPKSEAGPKLKAANAKPAAVEAPEKPAKPEKSN